MRLGPGIERHVLLPLARSLVYATREDLIPEFSKYGSVLAETIAGASVAGVTEPSPSQEALDDAGVASCLEWTRNAYLVVGKQEPGVVFDSLVAASALGLARYNTRFQEAYDKSVKDSVGWLSFTHALTFVNAVHDMCVHDPEYWPAGLLQMACFVGRNHSYQDLARVTDEWVVEDPEPFFDESRELLLDHRMRDPIFSSHLAKTTVAVRREHAISTPGTGELVLVGLNLFLHAPIKQKHARRLARQAIDLVARDHE